MDMASYTLNGTQWWLFGSADADVIEAFLRGIIAESSPTPSCAVNLDAMQALAQKLVSQSIQWLSATPAINGTPLPASEQAQFAGGAAMSVSTWRDYRALETHWAEWVTECYPASVETKLIQSVILPPNWIVAPAQSGSTAKAQSDLLNRLTTIAEEKEAGGMGGQLHAPSSASDGGDPLAEPPPEESTGLSLGAKVAIGAIIVGGIFAVWRSR